MNKINILSFFLVLLLMTTGTLTSCSSSNQHSFEFNIKFRKELAKVVYNNSIREEEKYLPFEIEEENLDFSLSNYKWKYTDLKINNSFIFSVKMNTSLTPYFSTDLTNEKVDIIIANIELNYQQKHLNGWFEENMMIIKYDREIIGFMSPGQYNYNNENVEDDTDLYAFGSYMFLTENYKVKYYEETDYLYDFYINARNKENIILSTHTSYLGMKIDNGSVEMISESYNHLSTDITSSFIGESIIDEIKTTGIVTDICGEKIYVTSEETPSIKSVTLFINADIYINNVLIADIHNYDPLIIGEIIEFSYYQRYSSYIPIDIYVSKINICR